MEYVMGGKRHKKSRRNNLQLWAVQLDLSRLLSTRTHICLCKYNRLQENFHTIYLKNAYITHGAYLPAIEQLYSPRAFVEVIPQGNCVAEMYYLTVLLP